jgi:acyl carrier protein
MSDIDTKTLEKEIRAIVAEICECEEEAITPEADFVDELGMDSMQALEILAAVEKRYKVQIPEDYLGKIDNLTNLLNIARDLIK